MVTSIVSAELEERRAYFCKGFNKTFPAGKPNKPFETENVARIGGSGPSFSILKNLGNDRVG